MAHASPSAAAGDLGLFPVFLGTEIVAGVRLVPVGCPFLRVAGHVHRPVRARAFLERAYRHGAAVLAERIYLLCVEVAAPWELPAVGAAGGLLPFSLGRKSFALPLAVGIGFMPGYEHHWMLIEPLLVGAIRPVRRGRRAGGLEEFLVLAGRGPRPFFVGRPLGR